MSIDTPAWVSNAVFYQIFPDRFAASESVVKPSHLQPWGATPTYHGFQGGDLPGIVERLDYLEELGINALYLNPIFTSASNHRYHTYDYFQVDPLLGGNDALRQLLDAAHARNIRVVLDGVFNHASRGFFQFNHLLECGPESPYRDWFHVKKFPLNAYREEEPVNYDAWWGLHALPKFDTDHEQVREFLWSVGTHWLEQGIDGWRLDVPNEIDDDAFWQEFRQRCRAVNPDCYIVGELWGDARRWLVGDQFDGQMNYPLARAALGFVGGARLARAEIERSGYDTVATLSARSFARRLNQLINETYAPAVVKAQMNVLDTHDTPRLMTMLNGDRKGVKMLYTLLFTLPGAPTIYYGSEIGMTGRHDPDCRRAFPWHRQESWDHELQDFVRRLVQLRRNRPILRQGTFTIVESDRHCVLFRRNHGRHLALIALNAGTEDRTVAPWDAREEKTLEEMLAPAGSHLPPGGTVTIPGRTARIWLTPS